MGKTILGKDRRSGIVASGDPLKKIKIQQDSPKQNYILCPECEKFFEVLETYSAEYLFKRISNKRFYDNFNYQVYDGIEFTEIPWCNGMIFKLFVLSILWRCSITSEQPFSKFQIVEENEVRDILLSFKTNTIDTLLVIHHQPSKLLGFEVTLLKCKTPTLWERHFFYVHTIKGKLHQLFLNEYIFFLASEKCIEIADLGPLTNIGDTKLKIGFIENQLWQELIEGVLKIVHNKSSN